MSTVAVERLARRGLIHTTTLLDAQTNRFRELSLRTSVYAGFDPTARSLHVGNLLALVGLLHFRLAGHPTLALVGGATGRIGDPSWRSTAKTRLDEGLLEGNVAGIKGQLVGFFDRAFDYISTLRQVPSRLAQHQVIDNYGWYENMSILRFLDTVGSRTRVATLVSRDCVRSRMQSEHGLSFAELTYQLLQAYDFCRLYEDQGCRLQIGGSDQWGNILSGLDLVGKMTSNAEDPAHGLTMPLLLTGSGEKMGKSAGNAIWLDPALTSPFSLYQYFADCADNDAISFLPKLSFRPLWALQEAIAAHRTRPEARAAQRLLAYDVCALVHSEAEAKRAETASDILFGRHHGPIGPEALESLAVALKDSAQMKSLPADQLIGQRLVDLIASHENISKNAVRQSIKSGGVHINGHRITDIHTLLGFDHFYGGICLIKTGKQSFILYRILDKLII